MLRKAAKHKKKKKKPMPLQGGRSTDAAEGLVTQYDPTFDANLQGGRSTDAAEGVAPFKKLVLS